MASSTIDELQINIVGSTMRAQDSIDELCKSLTRLKRSLKGLNSREVNITANATQNVTQNVRKLGGASNATTQMLNNLTGAFHKNRKAGSSLLSVVGKLYATFWMLRKAFGWISSSIQFASDLTEVQNVVRNAFGPESEKMINDFAGSLSILNFGMSELTTKEIASKFQAMGVALGVTNKQAEQTQKTIGELPEMYDSAADSMADVSLNLTKLAADMGSFYNQDPTQVAKSLEAVFTGQTRPLRQYGLDLTQATLAEWAMNQGMQVNFQTMTQAEKTMLRYQYVMSNARLAMGDFAATANTWANVIKTLKQQFQALGGVIGGVFVNAFKPALIALRGFMQNVLDFAKTIADALGAIFGWTIEITASGSGAADAMEGLADSIDDAGSGAGDVGSGLGDGAKAAKAIEKSLSVLPFDELNQLAKANDSGGSGSGSGGSGGGSGGSGGGGGMSGNGASAALVRTDSVLEKITSDIKTLEELGKYISDSLVKAMKSINWSEIYSNARNFGKGLAEFLNGLITPELFGETAKLIARSINTAMYAINSFATEFDWKNLGESIASGINNFFSEWDAKTAGINIMLIVNGVYETIDNILDNLDTTTIGAKIGTFIGEIDIEQILKGFTKLFNKVIDKVGEIFGASFDVAPVQTAILEGLAGIFVVSNFLPLATKFAGVLTSVLGVKGTVILGAIALVTSGIADNLLQELINAVDSVDWLDLGQKVGQWIVDALINVEWLKVIGHAAELVAKIGLAILELIGGALAGIATELGKKVADWFSENYDFSITKAFFGNMAGELDGVMTEVDVFFSQLRQKFDEWMLDMKQNNKFFDSITDFFGLTDENLKLDITAQITKQEDLRERHQRYLDELGKVNEAVDNTGGNTMIAAAADITKTDSSGLPDKQKNVNGMKANFATSGIQKGFDLGIYGMKSWFRYRGIQKGFDYGIYGMKSWFKSRGTQKGFDFGIYGMKSWFKHRDTQKGFNYNLYGFTANVKKVNVGNAAVTGVLTGVKMMTRANGGLFRNGRWHPIESFASGGSPYGGQIFRARENGNPELVGTLKGSTAVMNNNQIVDSVANGVARSISNIRFEMSGFRPPEIDMNALGNMIEYAVASAMANNSQPVEIYTTIKTQNDEVLARAVQRGNRNINYRQTAVGVS